MRVPTLQDALKAYPKQPLAGALTVLLPATTTALPTTQATYQSAVPPTLSLAEIADIEARQPDQWRPRYLNGDGSE